MSSAAPTCPILSPASGGLGLLASVLASGVRGSYSLPGTLIVT